MQALKGYQDSLKSFSSLLNYAALVDEGIVLNKDGSLMAGFFYRGQDADNLSATQRNALSAKINAILARLGSGFVTHHDVIRKPAQQYLTTDSTHFPDEISRKIDDERYMQFNQHNSYYESLYVVTLTYLPPVQVESKFSFLFKDNEQACTNLSNKHLEFFKKTLQELEDSLSSLMHIRRMKSIKTRDLFSQTHVEDELVSYLNSSICGEDYSINLPPCPMYLDAMIGAHEVWSGLHPKIGDKFISVVSIEGFPQESFPNMLNILDKLPLSYRWSTRFIFMDTQDALVHLRKHRRKWQQKVRGFADQVFRTQRSAIDQDAVEMVSEIESAMAETNSGLVTYGYYTSVVVLMHESIETLEEHARFVRNQIQKLNFLARIETLNAFEAWIGSLPGHAKENVRRPLLHTLNLSDLLPLSSVYAGHDKSPCPLYPKNAPALMQVQTEGSTPLKLNLHVNDVGHTLIFGPTGSGKSTLLAFIAAQFLRYQNAQIFAFDKGYSLFALTHACAGAHYEIGGDNVSLTFCPLAEIDTESDLAWAEEWIETLAQLQGVTVSVSQRAAIHKAMKLLQASRQGRTLTDFCINVQDHQLRDALSYYTLNGTTGELLDAENESLQNTHFQVFEMEHILALGEKTLLPVLLYLFRRIEKQLNGQPSLLLLDEAWLMLSHPVFREKIREWLKVLRKANCAVVLATQSLSDATRSGLLDVLQESCPTKIFLPNEEAVHAHIRELYHSFGLNERQVDLIATATKKKHYYFVNPEGQRLFELNLGPVARSFVCAASKTDIAL